MRPLFRVLVTAGPTRERIDSVRFISNFSTGAMGYALAEAAAKKGYKVTLISGPTGLQPVRKVCFISVESAREMRKAVKNNLEKTDCFFMTSAVCDWRPEKITSGKLKKGAKKMTLKLTANPDILFEVGKNKGSKVLIGFALESKDLLKNARKKLKVKNLDLIVANTLNGEKTPFGRGKTNVTIVDKYGARETIKNATKKDISKRLLTKAFMIWQKKA